MTPAEQLLQRYQDGEANRAQQVMVEGLIASDVALARKAQRLEHIDTLLRIQAERLPVSDPALVAERVMERLPAFIPRTQAKIGLGHVLVGGMTVALVILASLLTALFRPWMPTEGIATACAIVGLALLVAARPLAQIENSLLARLMAKRVTVGDGEVLVCRALGIALLIGAAHIVGIWS